jgi:membrane dipeptidase
MKIWDLHCDVLSKLLIDESIRFEEDTRLDVSLKNLTKGGVQLQAFAIYIPENWRGRPFEAVLLCIDIFYRLIAAHPQLLPIQSVEDLDELIQSADHRIGALLTLEGADGLESNFTYFRLAYQLGVRTLGLTWNNTNWVADGVGERRSAGFTSRGKQFIAECDQIRLPIDVSHLSERGFWELTGLTKQPFIASHSNLRAKCNHPRNLTDEQARYIIRSGGRIGITFVPHFLRNDGKNATIADILNHLDHVCSLGGVDSVGFASDFDGITARIVGLENTSHYDCLMDELVKRYRSDEIKGFLSQNWASYYRTHLPSRTRR